MFKKHFIDTLMTKVEAAEPGGMGETVFPNNFEELGLRVILWLLHGSYKVSAFYYFVEYGYTYYVDCIFCRFDIFLFFKKCKKNLPIVNSLSTSFVNLKIRACFYH